jgi:hypothetical protein
MDYCRAGAGGERVACAIPPGWIGREQWDVECDRECRLVCAERRECELHCADDVHGDEERQSHEVEDSDAEFELFEDAYADSECDRNTELAGTCAV